LNALTRTLLLLGGLAALGTWRSAEASVVFKGIAIDAAATVEKNRSRILELSDSDKVPLAGAAVTLRFLANGVPAKSWTAATDANGHFEVDTQLSSLPGEGRFVVETVHKGETLFSPFLLPSGAVEPIHLYAPSEDASNLGSPMGPILQVEHNVDDYENPKTGVTERVLHVTVSVTLLNAGSTMYVGTRRAGQREVFRIPLPEGATVLQQDSPDPASPGWLTSSDGRWLILDTPIPGVLDIDRQIQKEGRISWRIVYVAPGRQISALAYPLPMSLDGRKFEARALHKKMALESEQLIAFPEPQRLTAGLDGANQLFDVMANPPLDAKQTIVLGLTVDSLPLKQVARGPLAWVGGFVLVLLLSVLCGLGLGRKGASPDMFLSKLSGAEVIDRIADLDRRHAAGEISDRDHGRYREALVRLASAELRAGESAADGGAAGGASAPSATAVLPAPVREILERIEAIDASGATDPAAISDRTHLLEALLKAVQRNSAGDGEPAAGVGKGTSAKSTLKKEG